MIMEGKIIKARKKNEGEYFCDIKVEKFFIENTQCAIHRWKVDKLDYIKV